MTLKFLGDIDEDKIVSIIDNLVKIKYDPFSLTTDVFGVFPSERNIKTLWLGIKDYTEVKKLQQQIEDALASQFEKDDRFHPHLTLSRVKHLNPEEKKEFVKQLKATPEEKTVAIDTFYLIKSTLTPAGARYERVAEFKAK